MIDLSNVPAEQRETLREQIKADKQTAIEKRLAKVKIDEETTAKLEKLKAYEEKEQVLLEKKVLEEKEQSNDKYLKDNKLTDLDSFKELKAYDKFMSLEEDAKKEEFLKELQKTKPNLFKNVGIKKSILDLSNISVKDTSDKPKVY